MMSTNVVLQGYRAPLAEADISAALVSGLCDAIGQLTQGMQPVREGAIKLKGFFTHGVSNL